MRLPIGIQDFTNLRESDYVYVDKTMYLNELIKGGRFFLSRPRRFGKSLLLSTFKAIFAGRKDLFQGLWLENHHDFKPRPIIRLDFSNINFTSKTLDEGIVDWLRINALEYEYVLKSTNVKDAFRELILGLSKTAKVVVLIDEYDKPITDYLFEPEKRSLHQETLKTVYGALKPLDAHLHLVLITGVSKIGKLSLFSDLNNLHDISLHPKYALVCGYSKPEIETHFSSYLENAAKTFQIPLAELWQAIAFWYNGYSWDAVQKVYCPFSFLLFLDLPEFKSYWYETGTPTFLVEMIKNRQIDPLQFEKMISEPQPLIETNIDNLNPIGLMFQTGYLSIVRKQSQLWGVEYELAYPNNEVRVAFSKGLLEAYSQHFSGFMADVTSEIRQHLFLLKWTELFARVNQVLASIPYEIFPRQETYFNSLLYLMLVSTGLRTQSQVQTSLGRMDILLETPTHFIIFELKIGGTPEAALEQIISTKYAKGLSGKPVIGVGVVFDLETKSIVAWQDQLISA